MYKTKFQFKSAMTPFICLLVILSGLLLAPAAMAAKRPLQTKLKSLSILHSTALVAHTYKNPLHPTFGSTMDTSKPTIRYNKLTKGVMKSNVVTSSPDLEDDFNSWNIYHDQGFTDGSLTALSNPSLDGSALQVQMGTGQPYAGIHAYENLNPADTATSFNLDTSFYFSDIAPVQALEFTMNKWVGGQRYEWALQWQVIQDGGPQQGLAQSWRLWNGFQWINTGGQQILAPNAWHTLHLQGSIDNGQVHYASFDCDSVGTDLTAYSYPPVNSDGDKLAVGVQLDGNAFETPYNLTIEHVHLSES